MRAAVQSIMNDDDDNLTYMVAVRVPKKPSLSSVCVCENKQKKQHDEHNMVIMVYERQTKNEDDG